MERLSHAVGKAFVLGLIWILMGTPGTLAADEPSKQPTAPSGDVQERAIRPGFGELAPRPGTVTPFKCETNYPAGQNVCLCKGTADCFDMGSKNVCKTDTIDCPAGQGHCTCIKKQ